MKQLMTLPFDPSTSSGQARLRGERFGRGAGELHGFAGQHAGTGLDSHAFAAYRALERMPEVAKAQPVVVESLEDFLKAEERPIEALLASQEAWAAGNLKAYPARPAALAFTADAKRDDAARRLAFLRALRVAPGRPALRSTCSKTHRPRRMPRCHRCPTAPCTRCPSRPTTPAPSSSA